MNRITMVLVTIALSLPAVAAAACAVPSTYRKMIEDRLAVNHPTKTDFTVTFMEPKRVFVGDKKKPMCAVRCYWSATQDGADGGRLLGAIRSDFLFEERSGLLAKVREAFPGEKIEWLDGEPFLQMAKKANKAPEPTPGAVTPRATSSASK